MLEDQHSIIYEARGALECVQYMVGNDDEPMEHVTGSQLFFMLKLVSDKMTQALALMEAVPGATGQQSANHCSNH